MEFIHAKASWYIFLESVENRDAITIGYKGRAIVSDGIVPQPKP